MKPGLTNRAKGRRTASAPSAAEPLWYKDAIFYELRVGAFSDSDGDGIGDFRGLTERLDYLRDLGVNTLWISPLNEATPGDFGYEVLDHAKLRADYGRPADLQRLVRGAHARGMKVLLDFVPNHVFDEHR